MWNFIIHMLDKLIINIPNARLNENVYAIMHTGPTVQIVAISNYHDICFAQNEIHAIFLLLNGLFIFYASWTIHKINPVTVDVYHIRHLCTVGGNFLYYGNCPWFGGEIWIIIIISLK